MPASLLPPFFLGIDLGGTNIKSGVVDDHGPAALVDQPGDRGGPGAGRRASTTWSPPGTRRSRAAGLDWDRIAAVGLGSPGTMDIDAGMLLDPPNLPGLGQPADPPVARRSAQEAGRASERRQRGRLRRILGRRRQEHPQPGDVHARHRCRRWNRGRRHDHPGAPQPRRRMRPHHHRGRERPPVQLRRPRSSRGVCLGHVAGQARPSNGSNPPISPSSLRSIEPHELTSRAIAPRRRPATRSPSG